mgnify:CR=1 FL=1
MELKPGYKQTEVGVIPEDWDVYPLAEHFHIFAGGDVPKHSFSEHRSEDFPYPIFSNSLREAGLYGFTAEKRAKPDSLTITGRGHLGHAEYRKESFFPIVRLVTLEPTGDLDAQFTAFSVKQTIEFAIESTGVPQLTAPQVGRHMIPAPPISEQRDVARALADADALLNSLGELLNKKKAIKEAAIQELLTGKRRLPGFEGEWEVKRLGELGTWRGGMTPSMQNPSYWVNGDFPWISSGDIKVSQLSETSQNVTSQAVMQGAAVVVPAQTIVLVTRSGILRKYLPVALIDKPMAINQDIKALIPHEGICSKFLLHAITCAGDKILASCMKSGTTVESVEFSWLKPFALPIPLIEEQEAIASVLSEMDAEISALDAQRDRTRALKQAMMQELLTGRIRLR